MKRELGVLTPEKTGVELLTPKVRGVQLLFLREWLKSAVRSIEDDRTIEELRKIAEE